MVFNEAHGAKSMRQSALIAVIVLGTASCGVGRARAGTQAEPPPPPAVPAVPGGALGRYAPPGPVPTWTGVRVGDVIGVIAGELTASEPARRVAAVRALRRLADPGLEPLLTQLAISGDPLVMTEAILAAADASGRPIDLLLARRIEPEPVRGVLIARALAEGLLEPEQTLDLVSREGLSPETAARLAVWHERLAGGNSERTPIDDTLVRAWMDAPSPVTGLLAAGLRAERQDELGEVARRVLARRVKELAALPEPERARALTALGSSRLPALLGVVFDRSLSPDGIAPDAVLRAGLLLGLGTPEARAAWRGAWHSAQDPARRTALSLLVLGTLGQPGSGLPQVVSESWADEPDPVNRGLIELAQRWAAGPKADSSTGPGTGRDDGALGNRLGQTAAQLIALRHPPGVEWLLARADELGPVSRAGVAAAVRAAIPVDPGAELWSIVAASAGELAGADPEGFIARVRALHQSGQTDRARQALLGAVRSVRRERPTIGTGAELLEAARTWPDAATRSWVTLWAARGAEPQAMTEADMGALARAALGEGGLEMPERIQAAWVLLRASGQDSAALSRLLALRGDR
ncbi:MAG: hypothetical protein C0475_02780 [Planctomyces sp.]|nr:hypothetical protein [Planctomyces sp.]